MQTPPTPETDSSPEISPHGSAHPESAVIVALEEELLIEEISIDGMCGVY
ncbi:MAG: mycofactocin precursor [Ilumatobacteraceae bacterium]|nr:mycofactocin precursor [Ilumatobacteraceae bacterium]